MKREKRDLKLLIKNYLEKNSPAITYEIMKKLHVNRDHVIRTLKALEVYGLITLKLTDRGNPKKYPRKTYEAKIK